MKTTDHNNLILGLIYFIVGTIILIIILRQDNFLKNTNALEYILECLLLSVILGIVGMGIYFITIHEK